MDYSEFLMLDAKTKNDICESLSRVAAEANPEKLAAACSFAPWFLLNRSGKYAQLHNMYDGYKSGPLLGFGRVGSLDALARMAGLLPVPEGTDESKRAFALEAASCSCESFADGLVAFSEGLKANPKLAGIDISGVLGEVALAMFGSEQGFRQSSGTEEMAFKDPRCAKAWVEAVVSCGDREALGHALAWQTSAQLAKLARLAGAWSYGSMDLSDLGPKEHGAGIGQVFSALFDKAATAKLAKAGGIERVSAAVTGNDKGMSRLGRYDNAKGKSGQVLSGFVGALSEPAAKVFEKLLKDNGMTAGSLARELEVRQIALAAKPGKATPRKPTL
jgi:hypothetical protein